jgi:hypothetical protein
LPQPPENKNFFEAYGFIFTSLEKIISPSTQFMFKARGHMFSLLEHMFAALEHKFSALERKISLEENKK